MTDDLACLITSLSLFGKNGMDNLQQKGPSHEQPMRRIMIIAINPLGVKAELALAQHWPGGGEHQAEDAVRLLRQFLQDGQHKRRRLSTSCLGTAHTVATWRGKNKGSVYSWNVIFFLSENTHLCEEFTLTFYSFGQPNPNFSLTSIHTIPLNLSLSL